MEKYNQEWFKNRALKSKIFLTACGGVISFHRMPRAPYHSLSRRSAPSLIIIISHTDDELQQMSYILALIDGPDAKIVNSNLPYYFRSGSRLSQCDIADFDAMEDPLGSICDLLERKKAKKEFDY